jgi:predicted permease
MNALLAHWDILRQDLSSGLRLLARSPGYAFTIVLVTALGVGANTAVFSVTDHVLIRPLPFPDAERLVKVWEDQTVRGYSQNEPSPANYRDWKTMSRSFEALTAWRGLSVNMQGNGEPERLEGAAVTADVFPMLGARALYGRVFTAEDDTANAAGTLILSHDLWHNRFGADRGVIGRRLVLDDGVYTIIGVMPPGFNFPLRTVSVWAPMRFAPVEFRDRENNFLHVTGKLRPGVSLEAARAEMHVIAARLKQQYPKENAYVGVRINRLRDEMSQRARLILLTLMAGSLCVLLITCTNLANLMLARALSRRRELSVRSALGAGRERLIRQLLTESVLLALAGGAVGVGMAMMMTPLLGNLVPSSLPIGEQPAIDLRVLGFALLVTIATGIGFAIIPALRSGRDGVAAGLREGSRQGIGGRRRGLQAALLVAEVTASLVLVVCAGLLGRALLRLQSTDPGFRSEGVLTVRTSLPMPKYLNVGDRQRFYNHVLTRLRNMPGVQDAGFTSFLPLVLRGGIHPVSIEGRPVDPKRFHDAPLRFVTPGYLSTLRIPLLRGRDIADSDTKGALPVAVVSESFVKTHFPNEDPIGRRIRFGSAIRTIVGIVGDIKFRGLERNSEPQVYLSSAQVEDGWYLWFTPKDLAVRSSVTADQLLPAIRRIIAEADPAQPVSDVQTLEEIVAAEGTSRRVQLTMIGAFAALAFLLAAVGIHGLMSFIVAQRSQEIGVRRALGARSSSIIAMVLRQSVLIALCGTAFGLALAYIAARGLETMLLGIRPADPLTFTAGALICLLMALGGSLAPAVRAVRVDPMHALRAE